MRSAENFPFRGKFSEVYMHLNSADISSDYYLLMAACVLEMRKQKPVKFISRKYYECRLENNNIAEDLEVKVGGRFQPLLGQEIAIDDPYESSKKATNFVVKEVVGHKRLKQLDGMNDFRNN